MQDRTRSQIVRQDPRCPFCHEEVALGQPQLACNGCRAWHHQGCWAEGGQRCSACGGANTGHAAEEDAEAPLAPQAAARGRVAARARLAAGEESSHTGPNLGDWLWLGGNTVLALAAVVGILCLPILGIVLGADWFGRQGTFVGAGVGVLASALCLVALRRWLHLDDAERLGLPGPAAQRSGAQRVALAKRFPSSLTAFRKTGLSLELDALTLDDARVLCVEQARFDGKFGQAMVHVLEPFALDQAETPLILVTSTSDDETLQVLEVNVARGTLPWVAIRADAAELARLAAATSGTVVAAGREPKIRHVGRAGRVTIDADGVTIGGAEGEVRLPTG